MPVAANVLTLIFVYLVLLVILKMMQLIQDFVNPVQQDANNVLLRQLARNANRNIIWMALSVRHAHHPFASPAHLQDVRLVKKDLG